MKLINPMNTPSPTGMGKPIIMKPQLVEHNTFNVGVLGSSPKRITKKIKLKGEYYESDTLLNVFISS